MTESPRRPFVLSVDQSNVEHSYEGGYSGSPAKLRVRWQRRLLLGD